MLLRRESLDISAAIRRVVALQAQEPPSPYVALWNRLDPFDPAHLDAAFVSHEVVKATLMRITLHAVSIEDYPTFREAMDPSLYGGRLRDRRFLECGLSDDDVHTLIPDLLAHADQPRLAAEMGVWLEERLGESFHPAAWWGLRQYAPLVRAPSGGPWSFALSTSYVSPRALPMLRNPEASAESLRTLVLRYLAGFGPASVADIAQFALVQRSRVKEAIQSLADQLVHFKGPKGEALFDIHGGLYPDEDTPAPPRLLGMWDNILLSYADRSRVIPEEYRKIVIRNNGDTLPTLLVDGYVAGVWRVVDGAVEATAFHPLADDVWEGLTVEARSLLAFLADRDPLVYRRFNHWWDKLPGGDTRLLRQPEPATRGKDAPDAT